jgi:hypothetical protein
MRVNHACRTVKSRCSSSVSRWSEQACSTGHLAVRLAAKQEGGGGGVFHAVACHTHAVAIVPRESGMATRSPVTIFTIKVAAGCREMSLPK